MPLSITHWVMTLSTTVECRRTGQARKSSARHTHRNNIKASLSWVKHEGWGEEKGKGLLWTTGHTGDSFCAHSREHRVQTILLTDAPRKHRHGVTDPHLRAGPHGSHPANNRILHAAAPTSCVVWPVWHSQSSARAMTPLLTLANCMWPPMGTTSSQEPAPSTS